jgi:ribosomal-protein-alanine N-acetyltransferase
MIIRRLVPEDAPAIADLFAVISDDQDAPVFFGPHGMRIEDAQRVCGIVDAAGDEYFAAFADERVIGYGMLRGWSEGYEVPAFGVYVHPGERGRGVGASLLSWAVERARDRGAGSIMLKVSPKNAAAVGLYRSHGFTFSGETMDSQLVGRLSIAQRMQASDAPHNGGPAMNGGTTE